MARKRCRSTTLHHRLRSGCTAVRTVRRTRATAFFRPPSRGSARFDTTAVIGTRLPRKPTMSLKSASSLRSRAQLDQQLLGCRSFGRIAEVHDDQASALDALEPLGDRPMINCPWVVGASQTWAIPSSILEQTSSARCGLVRAKSASGRPHDVPQHFSALTRSIMSWYRSAR